MRMKAITIVVAFIVQFFCFSCDNREDYFIAVNNAPILKIYKNGAEITEGSITDSLKIGFPYVLNYLITDEEKITLNVVREQGQDLVDIKNEKVTFTGSEEGQSRFTLQAEDSFHATASFTVNFTVFRNIRPVASFTVKKIGVSSPYEYEIDATASYDKDAKFSGKVVEYEYTLQNYVCTTTLNKIRYVFGSPGQKLIKLRVQDNTGDWSDIVSQYVVLN